MATVEITEQGIKTLETLEPDTPEARFLSALEESGPSNISTLLPQANPQQQRQVVKNFTDSGLIKASEVPKAIIDSPKPEPSSDFHFFSDITIPPIKTDTEVHTPDVRIPDISISPDGNIVGDITISSE